MLEQERRYYNEHLSEWLEHFPGQFVLVKDESLVGAFNTLDQALTEGARRFGLTPFLVRQVRAVPLEVTAPALTLGLLRADS